MIAVHKIANKIVGFRLLDTDTGQVKDVSYQSLYNVLKNNVVEVENVKLERGSIVGSNGSLQRYPVLVNGQLYGKSPIVILFELPNNCYRVTNYTGEIVDMHEQEMIKYAETEGIANGKVVTNEDGTKFISSIAGTYKKDEILLDKQRGTRVVAKMKIFGKQLYDLDENRNARVVDKSIEELILPEGVLGIADKGFENCVQLKEVQLPNTLERLGKASFKGCKSLEKIVIPEGITVIPEECFEGCENLKEVHLPNSLVRIEHRAFFRCRKLKRIYCGPRPIEVVFGAIPSGVRRVRRQMRGVEK